MSQTAPVNQVAGNPQQALRTEGPATVENDSEEMTVEAKNVLLVVAALIMTATYQAVLQPPGGLWQDDSGGSSNSTDTSSDNHTAGEAIMGTKSPRTYVWFLFFNSVGFFGSYVVIWSLLEGFPRKRKRELRLALVALVCTYDVSMGALKPNRKLNWIFVGISILMPFIFSMIVWLIENVCQ